MTDAIARMAFYLSQAPGWKPDRSTFKGPAERVIVSVPARPVRTQPAAIKRRIITALEKGPSALGAREALADARRGHRQALVVSHFAADRAHGAGL